MERTLTEHEKKVVEQTLEAKVGELLTLVARQAGARVRKRWGTSAVILLILVLGGLISLQVQFYRASQGRDAELLSRCAERNAQQASVAEFARQMSSIEATNSFVDRDTRETRIRAYDVLAAAYGVPLDCSIYK